MFGGNGGHLRDIRYEDGSYTFKVTNTTVFRKTIIEALANSYFSALLRGNPFPIPNSILGKRISGAFALHLFNRSNMTNGLYSDVVTEPLKMRLPNVDMNKIFQRFENDIEKVCAFYWERRGMYPLSKVCEGGRQQEKSLLERLTNEIQALPSTFAFSFVPSYEMICSSFTSKRRLELMEEILSRCTAKYEFSIWTSKIDFEIDEIENKSLQKLSPLFESVRKRINGPKENHLEIKNMVNLFPNISRIIILNALVLHIHSNLKEDDILNVRSAFGLPTWPYPTLKEALNLMQDDGEETTGNFEILPSWIPIEAYVMGGRNNVMQKVFQKTQVKGVLEK